MSGACMRRKRANAIPVECRIDLIIASFAAVLFASYTFLRISFMSSRRRDSIPSVNVLTAPDMILDAETRAPLPRIRA